MIIDLGNRVSVDWTSQAWATAPAAAYAAWAAELGVSPTASLYALDGDDDVNAIDFAVAPLPGGVVGGSISTEGGLGLYVRAPYNRSRSSQAFVTRQGTAVGRMYVFSDGPGLLLTWHPDADCRFVGARLQRAGASTLIAGRVQHLSTETFRTDFALRLDGNQLTLILTPIDQPVPVCALDAGVAPVPGHTLETVPAGATRRIAATLGYAPPALVASVVELPLAAVSQGFTGWSSAAPLPEGFKGRRNHQIDAGQGIGRVRGSTLDYQAPVNRPYACRVVLLRERDMLVVREQRSQPDGSYDFQYVDELQSYTVLAYYGEHAKLAVVSDGLSLDNGKVERMP